VWRGKLDSPDIEKEITMTPSRITRRLASAFLTLALVLSFAPVAAVNAAPSLSPSSQTVSATVGAAITATTAFTATEIPGTKTFSITPALPAGLTMSTSTGVVSGTPTTTQSATTYTVTASDGTASATATIAITVSAATVSATAVVPASQAVSGFVGVALVPTAALTAAAVTGTKVFSITPTLPAGLTLNAATGVISGTPSAVKAATTYIVTVSDGTNFGVATVRLTVSAAGQLTPVTQTVVGRVGSALTPTAVLTSTTLGTSRTFAVTPPLPTGLVLNTTSGVVSGTPVAVLPTTTYTVTGSDGTNSAIATLVMSVTVTGLPASPGTNSSRPGCRPVTFAANANKTLQAVDAELPNLDFACSVHIGIKNAGIAVAISVLGTTANPKVARYSVTARRVGAGSVTKNIAVRPPAQVLRRQFRPLRAGTWVVSITALAPNGTSVGTWTSDAFTVN
jgi:hypothetical protein